MRKTVTSRRNLWLCAPLIILLIGILLYSGITLYLNITLPPSEMNRLLIEDPELFDKRFAWIESKENMMNVFNMVFRIGSIVVLCYYIFASVRPPELTKVILGFVVSVASVFLCALILSPFDKEYSASNYLAPIWIPLMRMTVYCLAMLIISLVKPRTKK